MFKGERNMELIITIGEKTYLDLVKNFVKKDKTILELKETNKKLRKQIKALQKNGEIK